MPVEVFSLPQKVKSEVYIGVSSVSARDDGPENENGAVSDDDVIDR